MGGNKRVVQTALVGAALLVACAASELTTPRNGDASALLPAPSTLRLAPPPPPPPPPAPAAPPVTQPPATVPVVEPPPPAPVHLPPGVHEHQVGDHVRRWTTVVPERVDGRLPSALVVVLHGVGGRGIDMRGTGFEPRAAATGAVLAYPDALGGAWNDGRPGADAVVPGPPVDDVAFLRLLIGETTGRTGVEGRRVAVVGYSNGAIMAGRLACDAGDAVAAVALVGGAGGQGFEQSCRPSVPVAVMVVAGSADRIVPYGGGRVADWGTRRRGFVAPIEDFFSFWRAADGCTSTVTTGSQVAEARATGCRSGTSVVRYRVNGGGHEWFRPPTFDTTGTVWEFVTRRLVTPA